MKKVLLIFSLLLISIGVRAQDLRTYPVLWHQTSAEYRALCYQAFNVARTYLETISEDKEPVDKYAIVTDLDETILDNSFLEAKGIKEGKAYDPAEWKKWVNMSASTAVPGAVDFLNWAACKGFTIFYISNRTPEDIPSTIINLKKLMVPFADAEHMLFLEDGSTKEPRRKMVEEKYKIVMLMGDNLNDFTTAFEKRSVGDRKREVDQVREEWGKRFIVLPNAIYGEWEKAIFNYNNKLTPEQKETIRKEALVGY